MSGTGTPKEAGNHTYINGGEVTEYAVTVQYTGDFLVEAESQDEAYAHVEQIIPGSTPDSDWYFVQIVGVRAEQLEDSLPDGAK